ncbi:MAG: cytochrome c biogenesis protein ResB [Muribaculaceae bacterium]
MCYVFVIGYLLIASILQLIIGNFPVSFMAFPLNVIFAVIWLFVLFILYKEYRSTVFTQFLCSPKTSILSIILFIVSSLIIGLFPQLSEIEANSREGVLASFGCYNFITSWIFIAIIILLLSNLAMIIFNAYKYKKHMRWRFILHHVGLWLALFGGFIGSSDTQTLRIAVSKGEPTQEAYDENGMPHYLDYEMELNSFTVEYYPNGRPSRFAADIRLGKENALLEVNHPYAHRFGEDVYLTSYDIQKGNDSNYCILQIVRQPWKYVTVAGILMMLVGAILLFIKGRRRV